MSAGTFLVGLAIQTGVDPSFILGIARAESSLATNPNVNGGMYNIYGSSPHFNGGPLAPYTNYIDPTNDVFNLIGGRLYLGAGLITSSDVYKRYEGAEAGWQTNLGYINDVQKALGGNVNDIRYSCDSNRGAFLAQ